MKTHRRAPKGNSPNSTGKLSSETRMAAPQLMCRDVPRYAVPPPPTPTHTRQAPVRRPTPDARRPAGGGIDYVAPGNFIRTDLVPSVAKYAIAQTSRGGYDDAIIYTTTGSYLYVGVQDAVYGSTLLDSGWYSNNKPMSSVDWFGRK